MVCMDAARQTDNNNSILHAMFEVRFSALLWLLITTVLTSE